MSAALVAATPQADIKLTCFLANVYEPAEVRGVAVLPVRQPEE